MAVDEHPLPLTDLSDLSDLADLSDLIGTELRRQADVLVDLGYPELVRTEALALAEPLRACLDERPDGAVAPTPGAAPFVLVPGPAQLPVSARVPMLTLNGRGGTLNRHFGDADNFRPVVEVPDRPAYAVVRVERGEEFCGSRPVEAPAALAGRGRTKLTMEEGIAFLHAVPEALERNKCFHTGASRGGDRRVPALWISERAPHLGWCWEHNHHTWLGVASAAGRVSVARP